MSLASDLCAAHRVELPVEVAARLLAERGEVVELRSGRRDLGRALLSVRTWTDTSALVEVEADAELPARLEERWYDAAFTLLGEVCDALVHAAAHVSAA